MPNPADAVKYCDGHSRRQMLQFGLGGLLGLTLPEVLKLRAEGAEGGQSETRDTAVIYVFMAGGPSQFETYDPKPEASPEIRGEFSAIRTNVPGVQFCELMPEQARIMDKLTILRGIHHPSTQHSSSVHLVQTGYYCAADAIDNELPSMGSYTAKIRGKTGSGVPPYVVLPNKVNYSGGHFLGKGFSPFEINSDPNHKDFKVPNLALEDGLTSERLSDRRRLMADLDRSSRWRDSRGVANAIDQFTNQAIDIVSGPAARRAFDLEAEPAAMRERYGRNSLGQSMLLARRLVEQGVSFVTVATVDWDNHGDLAKNMKGRVPAFDRGLAALVSDLHERGLAKRVLVVAMGEFGRAPIYAPFQNFEAGRDHWGDVFSVLMAGGGCSGGTVIGASDARGGTPTQGGYRVESVLAHMYRHLGIDPAQTFNDHNGRPRNLLEIRDAITEIG